MSAPRPRRLSRRARSTTSSPPSTLRSRASSTTRTTPLGSVPADVPVEVAGEVAAARGTRDQRDRSGRVCSRSQEVFRRHASTLGRAGLVVGMSVALVAGSLSQPPAALAGPAGAPAAMQQQPAEPGASGQKPGPAPIFTPGAVINRTVLGGLSSGPWSGNSSQGLPTDIPVDPSRQAKKPGLGTQDYYPIERRALGDRLEMLVNLANGNVIVRATDLVYAGTGINVGISHFYNNQADNRGSFGKKWTMSTGRDVGLDVSDPGKVVLQGPSGYRQDYTRNGDSFTSPSGANAKMTKTAEGYRLEFDKTKEKWNFDNNGFFTSQVDRNDNTINFNYNGNGTLASIRDTRGAVSTFEHDLAGRVTKMTDPTGYDYGGYSYDLAGQHTGFTTPDGKRVTFGYDQAGNLDRITDPNGNEYRLGYDDQRRVTTVDEPRETGVITNDRAVTTYAYNSETETESTNANGGTTTYTFDDEGRQEKAEDPLGREESKTYTANSDVATTTSVGGNVSTASFDPTNRLIGTQLPTGAQNAVGYTDTANPFAPTSMTDSEGRQTTATYDPEGNPLSVKQAQTGQGIDRTYNDNGTVKDSTDGKGQKTSYTYDGDGRLTRVTFPGPRRPVNYEYDSRSRLTAVTDGNGVTLEYAYDASDRVVQLSQRTSTGRTTIQRTDFDANGNKTANFHAGVTKRLTYNPRNQVMTDVRQGGLLTPTDTVAYTYDAVNNLSSLRDAGGTTRYAYNEANDLTELTDVAGGRHRYGYDDDGNRNILANPSGFGQIREFDDSGRATKFTNYARGAAASARSWNYGGARGDTELIQTMSEPNNSTTRYSYDGSSQLLRARNTNNANGAAITDYSYAYDRAGNITNFQGLGETRNASNQLTRLGNTTATSDGQGNIVADGAGGGANYTPTNQQNVRDAPDIAYATSYDTADSTQVAAIYDRVKATGATFAYEFTQTALGMTGRTRAGQGRYSISRDPDGAPVAMRLPNGQMRYFELDRDGSVTGTQRNDGTRGAAFHYKPYGEYDLVQGPDSSNADNFISFQGGFFHSTAKNLKFGHRWYMGNAGQWTQPDPIGTPGSSGSGQDNRSGIGGPYSTELNAYNFTNNNPCNNTDPTGLLTEAECEGLNNFSIASGIVATGTGINAAIATGTVIGIPVGIFFGTISGVTGIASAATGLTAFYACD